MAVHDHTVTTGPVRSELLSLAPEPSSARNAYLDLALTASRAGEHLAFGLGSILCQTTLRRWFQLSWSWKRG